MTFRKTHSLRTIHLIATVVVAAMIAAACGGGDDPAVVEPPPDTTTAVDVEQTTEAPSPTTTTVTEPPTTTTVSVETPTSTTVVETREEAVSAIIVAFEEAATENTPSFEQCRALSNGQVTDLTPEQITACMMPLAAVLEACEQLGCVELGLMPEGESAEAVEELKPEPPTTSAAPETEDTPTTPLPDPEPEVEQPEPEQSEPVQETEQPEPEQSEALQETEQPEPTPEPDPEAVPAVVDAPDPEPTTTSLPSEEEPTTTTLPEQESQTKTEDDSTEEPEPAEQASDSDWVEPYVGLVPEVHPDTPPTAWERGDLEPGGQPIEIPRSTGADRVQVAAWIEWMGGTNDSYTQWLMGNMKWAVDYLGAHPECVVGEYYARVTTSRRVTPANQAEPGYLWNDYGWHNCATVIDPYIAGVVVPDGRDNDVGLRLSDTSGITLTERCRTVLPSDIELETYRYHQDANGDRIGEPGYHPYEPGHAGCAEWAEAVESNYWFVHGDYPDCSRSASLAAQWMQHYHNRPVNYSINC